MRRQISRMWRSNLIAAVAVVALAVAVQARPLSFLPSQAASFLSYFEAAGQGEQPLSLWERVTFSLLFAANEPAGSRTSSPGSEPCRS
jgi:hypothetical protein